MTTATFDEDGAAGGNPEDTTGDGKSRARWDAVAALTIGVFGLVTSELLPVSLLTPISADMGISPGAAGQTVTVTAVVAAIAGPAVVVGSHRFDRRWVLLSLTALLIVSSLIAAVATSLPVLLLSRLLLGIGLGGFWAMSAALAMRLVPMHMLPRAMALIFGGVTIATVMAAPLGAYIGSTLGWRAAFVLSAVLGGVALLAQALTIPSLPPTGSAGLGGFATILARPKVRVGLITTLLIIAGHFAGFTYIRPYLEDSAHLGVEMISLTLLAYGVAGFFGNIAGGLVTERSSQLGVIFSSGLITLAAIALVAAGGSGVVAIAAVALWGFAFGAVPVSVQSYMAKAASDEAESAGALGVATFQIAISGGAVLGGLLIDLNGPVAVMLFLGVASLLGALIMAARGGREA